MEGKQDSPFPARLRALREQIGVSQADFAYRCGVSRASQSYYENGDRIPDIGYLARVVEKTRCSASYLLGESNVMREEQSSIADEYGLDESVMRGVDSLLRQYPTTFAFLVGNSHFWQVMDALQFFAGGTAARILCASGVSNTGAIRYDAHSRLEELIKDADNYGFNLLPEDEQEEGARRYEEVQGEKKQKYAEFMKLFRELQAADDEQRRQRQEEQSRRASPKDPFEVFREKLVPTGGKRA